MPTITTDDDVKISYRVVGSGGQPVLMVHGWMMNGGVYDDLIALLDGRGLRLVIPDLRGAGASDRPASGYSLARYARDLQALMDAESTAPWVIVGHSMGGQLAQLVAAEAPARVAGLVLLCPVPAAGVPLPADAQALFRGATSREPQAMILGMACKQLSAASQERLLGLGATVDAACIAESFDAWMTGGFAERLAAIRARTLVIGTDDPFLPPDFLRAAVSGPIAGARLAILPGPGHYVQVERPIETAALLEAFFAGFGGVAVSAS